MHRRAQYANTSVRKEDITSTRPASNDTMDKKRDKLPTTEMGLCDELREYPPRPSSSQPFNDTPSHHQAIMGDDLSVQSPSPDSGIHDFQDNCSSPLSVLTSEDTEEDNKRTGENILSDDIIPVVHSPLQSEDSSDILDMEVNRDNIEKAELAPQHSLDRVLFSMTSYQERRSPLLDPATRQDINLEQLSEKLNMNLAARHDLVVARASTSESEYLHSKPTEHAALETRAGKSSNPPPLQASNTLPATRKSSTLPNTSHILPHTLQSSSNIHALPGNSHDSLVKIQAARSHTLPNDSHYNSTRNPNTNQVVNPNNPAGSHYQPPHQRSVGPPEEDKEDAGSGVRDDGFRSRIIEEFEARRRGLQIEAVGGRKPSGPPGENTRTVYARHAAIQSGTAHQHADTAQERSSGVTRSLDRRSMGRDKSWEGTSGYSLDRVYTKQDRGGPVSLSSMVSDRRKLIEENHYDSPRSLLSKSSYTEVHTDHSSSSANSSNRSSREPSLANNSEPSGHKHEHIVVKTELNATATHRKGSDLNHESSVPKNEVSVPKTELPKRYSGPPSISMGAWGDKPRVNVIRIKEDKEPPHIQGDDRKVSHPQASSNRTERSTVTHQPTFLKQPWQNQTLLLAKHKPDLPNKPIEIRYKDKNGLVKETMDDPRAAVMNGSRTKTGGGEMGRMERRWRDELARDIDSLEYRTEQERRAEEHKQREEERRRREEERKRDLEKRREEERRRMEEDDKRKKEEQKKEADRTHEKERVTRRKSREDTAYISHNSLVEQRRSQIEGDKVDVPQWDYKSSFNSFRKEKEKIQVRIFFIFMLKQNHKHVLNCCM